jgi:tetratricopeptide (TPR) repeat protein
MPKVKIISQKLKVLNFLLGLLILLMLIMNLINSQLISPIYFRFINNDKNVTISFLEKIKTFPEFQKILEMNKNIYGKTVEEETFRQENNKKLMINNLEQILIKNPKARDVLYSLYLLYKEKGDNLTAEKYLKQAKEVDPSIK